MNMTMGKLLALVKNVGGQGAVGGGGGVQPDWNQNDPTAADYVKNRTHWAETALVEEVPETEITTVVRNGFASANMDASVTPSATEEGEICTIVFDGKEYECAMFILEGPSFGNGALFPGSPFPDTGEPFLYAYTPGEISMVVTHDTTPTTHTIACYKKGETVHTIDPKFLPAGSGGAFVVNITSTGEEQFAADKTYDETVAAIRNGMNVSFIWDDGEVVEIARVHTYDASAVQGSTFFSSGSDITMAVWELNKFGDVARRYFEVTATKVN